MSRESSSYSRVDVGELRRREALEAGHAELTQVARFGLRKWVAVGAVLMSVFQAVLLLYLGSEYRIELAGSLIPTMGFGLLFTLVLAVNPLLHWLELRGRRVPRPLGRAELMLVFSAMMLTSGVSTFGLVEVMVPQIAAPFNPQWNVPQRGWDEAVIPRLNRHLYITDPAVIAAYREGFLDVAPAEDARWTAHLKYQWYVLTHVPWLTWAAPLGWWLIFVGGAYVLFYSLSYVVLPFWSQREKLIFPLAKLPEALLPESDASGRWLPPVMSHPGFWLGLSVSFFVLVWNGGVFRENFPGLRPITLGMSSWTFASMVNGTIFSYIAPSISFLFLFTAMGLAFLLPQEMSFSVWFYYLASRGFLMALGFLGIQRNPWEDPWDFLWRSSRTSSMAGGGLLMFAALTLLWCLREFGWLVRSRTWAERFWYGLPVVGLGSSVAVLTAWLSWCGLDPWWALGLVTIITLMTLGLMRIVAESGIYWFQCFFGPFHLFQMLGMGRLIPNPVVAPFLAIYSVLFLDHKCFLAPNMLNAAKLREDVGGNRVRFHLTMWTSLALSVLASIVVSIFMAYSRGANRMHWWFYGTAQIWIMDTTRDLANYQPSFNASKTAWLVGGGLWVALTAYLRQSVFWFPHPVGFIMLVNPLMDQLWFSFFVAWLIRKGVLRYGGKLTFEKLRDMFLGLIMGEMLGICFYMCMIFFTHSYPANITLNKYAP
ncbi:MAG: hypothetical protein K8S99_00510 [Planctomycetes bacterium]|nr:hypothetical protein [Planctomycetota bacterium]